jgi:sugar lactone lactonase YvrE
MPASGVLGQTDFVTATSGLTASTLNGPKGIAIDPTTGKLFVADYENRRVLRWSSLDKMINGAAAEVVLGQPDFTSNTAGTSATLMSRPYGVYVDAAGRLWVTDLSNNRVLRFDNASTIPSGSPANKVLGQPDFVTGTGNTGGISASSMNRPISVYGDAAGNLYVSDRDNRRVLRFNNAAAKDNGDPADGVLGQPDFVTTTAGLNASTLGNRAWSVFVDAAGRLWVCDRDNHRVLRFDNAATKLNGAAAEAVLGQPDFVTGSSALTQSGLADPKGVFMDGLGRLFVSDEGNNRVKVYNNAATIGFLANADYVLGQPDFVTSTLLNPPTASSFNYAEFLWIDNAANHIWLADEFNHRILRFEVLVIPVELVSFTATAISNKVELRWSTATEKNNAGFAVEKNANGVWGQIGYVEGHGTSTETNNYFYTENTSAGKYQYRLKQIDFDGSFEYSNAVEVTVGLTVEDYQLSQNYPNPFNPSTTIKFAVTNTEYVTVKVHNMIGQEVATLFDGIANADEIYSLSFDAKELSSGVYLYTLSSASKNEVKKMSLMK